MAAYDYTHVDTSQDFTDDEVEDIFQEFLDDLYGFPDIAGYSFGTGRILREIDPIAFREEFNNWLDSEIKQGHYREYVDSPECEDCKTELSQDDVTESLYIYDRLVCPDCGVDSEECDICGLDREDCTDE